MRRLVPGKTVLRRIRICPSRRYCSAARRARSMAVKLGFRCSSTGVPMIINRKRQSLIGSARSSTSRRPEARVRPSISSAPSSKKGISPERICSTFRRSTS